MPKKAPVKRLFPIPHLHAWWHTMLACGIAAVCLLPLASSFWSFAAGRPIVTSVATQGGGTGTDLALSVARAADGSTYVSGVFRGDATFGNEVATGGHATIGSAYLAKYNPDGTTAWVRKALTDGSNASGNSAWWTAVDSLGNPYMGGTFTGSTSFEGTNVTSVGGGDLFLAKYDVDGDLDWVRTGGSSSNESYGSLIVTADNTAYVAAGCSSGTAGSTFSGTTIHNEGGNTGRDWCVIAYDVDGNLVRATMLGGITNQDDEPFGGIVQAADGGFFLSGDICCTAGNTGTMGGTAITVLGGGSNDIAVAKFDADFNLVWVNAAVNGTGQETPSGMVTMGGDVYVLSNFSTNITSYGEAGAISTAGGFDTVLAKYSGTDGSVLWAKTAGGTGTDSGSDMTTDGSNVYVTGAFSPSATIFGGPVLTGSGSRYGFVAKVRTDGTVDWALPVGGTGTGSTARGCTYRSGLWCVGLLQGTGTFSSFTASSVSGTVDGFLANISEIAGPTRQQPTRIGTVRLETNGGSYAVWSPDNDRLDDVNIADPACARTAYVSGDANGNDAVDNKERWTFTCKKSSGREGKALVYVRTDGFVVSAVGEPAP